MTNRVFQALILALALPVAVPSTAQAISTRPDIASGLSAADARALSAKYDVADKTLYAIAREVGLRNPGIGYGKLLDVVSIMAAQARNLLDQNKAMAKRLTALEDPTLRDPALAALKRAEKAIDEGCLTDAEHEYAIVRQLRWDESARSQAAWDAASDAQANTAELSQDY